MYSDNLQNFFLSDIVIYNKKNIYLVWVPVYSTCKTFLTVEVFNKDEMKCTILHSACWWEYILYSLFGKYLAAYK